MLINTDMDGSRCPMCDGPLWFRAPDTSTAGVNAAASPIWHISPWRMTRWQRAWNWLIRCRWWALWAIGRRERSHGRKVLRPADMRLMYPWLPPEEEKP